MCRRRLLILLLSTVASAADAPLPSFERYRVTDTFTGKPASPVLTTARHRQFRTAIREAAAKGVNFAGHYTVAQWGCGAGCISMAVVDAKDGRIYDGPFKVLAWTMVVYEGKISADAPGFEPLAFHRDSRLLIARGCPEEDNCGSYFYEWTGARFNLLNRVPATSKP